MLCRAPNDQYGPFIAGCDNLPATDAVLPGFGQNPCEGTDAGSTVSVPHSYLGGGILKPGSGPWFGQVSAASYFSDGMNNVLTLTRTCRPVTLGTSLELRGPRGSAQRNYTFMLRT